MQWKLDPIRYQLALIFLPFLFLYISFRSYRYFTRNSYLSGLKKIPQPPVGILSDNFGQFDAVSPYASFHKWAKEYGPLFRVTLGTQTLIVVSDPVIAKDLFEKRGGKYSSRKTLHVGFELMSKGRRIGFSPSGKMHRAFRKQMQSVLSITRGTVNRKHQELESRQVLKDIIDAISIGSAFDDHSLVQTVFRRYTASLMSTIAFGHRIPDVNDDGFARTIFDIMHDISVMVQPGRYLVDILPWMKYLPYCMKPWEWEVRQKMNRQWPFLRDLLTQARKQQDQGRSNPGIVRALLDQQKSMTRQQQLENFVDDESIAFQSMTILEAGSDTTTIGLMNFTLAMLLHPEIQEKAHAAIDELVAETALPTFDDVKRIPYIRQIVKEVLRWRPPLPNAIPHALVEDDEYNGYFFPKGSMVIGNVWSIHFNSEYYQNPDIFDPDRFKGDNKTAFESSNEVDPKNRDHFTFGWGRRICPGIHLAEDSLMLLFTRILWGFHIVPLTDSITNESYCVTADPERDYNHNIIESPHTFPVSFQLRSHVRASVIEQFHREALQIWDDLGLDLYQIGKHEEKF